MDKLAVLNVCSQEVSNDIIERNERMEKAKFINFKKHKHTFVKPKMKFYEKNFAPVTAHIKYSISSRNRFM